MPVSDSRRTFRDGACVLQKNIYIIIMVDDMQFPSPGYTATPTKNVNQHPCTRMPIYLLQWRWDVWWDWSCQFVVGYEVNAARAAMAAVVSHHSFGDGARELEGWLTLSLVDIKFFLTSRLGWELAKTFSSLCLITWVGGSSWGCWCLVISSMILLLVGVIDL
jgi:hypothetical protein